MLLFSQTLECFLLRSPQFPFIPKFHVQFPFIPKFHVKFETDIVSIPTVPTPFLEALKVSIAIASQSMLLP